MEYPRTVVLESDKLRQLLQEKTDLVLEGREMSQEIEFIENSMKAIDGEIQSIERLVDTKDIDVKAKEITDEMNAILDRAKTVKEELRDRLKVAVPSALIAQYEENEKNKTILEEERNKVALKVQKKNDKIIPLGRKLMAPYLQDEFEDYDTLRLEEGKVIATIFSHMEMFKQNHAKRVAESK
jgi:hypothetical protein